MFLDVGNFVKGEIYEVDDLVLKDLDELEDHPNFYIREEHDFKLPNGEKTKAWVYFIKNFKASLTNQEMYDNYTSLGSHGKKYVERYSRRNEIKYDYKSEIRN